MTKQEKAVTKLLAATLSNVAVVGIGLAIYQNQPLALIAAAIAIVIACFLEWRANE